MLQYAIEKMFPGEVALPVSARATAVGWAISIRLPARWRLIVDFLPPVKERKR